MDIVFPIYPGITQLDFTGPAQFLARLPGARIRTAAKSLDPIETDSGFSILPNATFADVRSADILCVPGGYGCVGAMEDPELLEWLEKVGWEARWVTSVCTGSLVLGAAGLMNGYRAACHWNWRHMLTQFGAEPVAERVVFDRNRVTGGGVTAGIDFALALMAAIAGEEHARLVQLGLEYDPSPPFDSGSPERAGAERVERLRAINPAADAEREARIARIAERLKATA